MGSKFGFNGAEGELEVQPAEFGLGFGRVGLEDLREVLKLLLNPEWRSGSLWPVGLSSARLSSFSRR